jgi:hypothetical protein
VADLDNALANLELEPVHQALRQQLDPALLNQLAAWAEASRAAATAELQTAKRRTRTAKTQTAKRQISSGSYLPRPVGELFDRAWLRCENFLRLAQKAYRVRLGREAAQPVQSAPPTDPSLLGPVFRERLRAALRIPAMEALFPAPWPAAARRVLPTSSSLCPAAALWGPVLGWCALELLAESLDAENPARAALELFDRLRLREPVAQAFQTLGLEGEEGWRAAARIKVALLAAASAGKPEKVKTPAAPEAPAITPATAEVSETEKKSLPLLWPFLWPSPWSDPDLRWLTGVHQSEGRACLLREPGEELLWWLLLPSLLCLAGESQPRRAAAAKMSRAVRKALQTAQDAKYSIDAPPPPPVAACDQSHSEG